jgi:hypothetical protein
MKARAEMAEKVVSQDLYIRNPPLWYRRVGNGPWTRVDLSIFGGRLPVVWLKPVSWLITETWQ